MKYLLYIFFTFSSLSIFAQSDVTILYIDASENDNRLDNIIQKAKDIINQGNGDILLYIANGENPIFSEERNDFNRKLNRIKREHISSPNLFDDVKDINARILENAWITDLNNNTELLSSISFVFMIEEENYHSFQIENKLIKRLLFSNNLYKKGVLKNNCSVNIILDKNNNAVSRANEIKFSYEYL